MTKPSSLNTNTSTRTDASLGIAIAAVSALLLMVVYGLLLRPMMLEQAALPLEIVFLGASIIAIALLLFNHIKWVTIELSIAKKLTQAIPTILLLFAIGLLIGSWMLSGTIPMLVYYGLKIISPDHIYLLAFIVPIFFSLCTGTSWGSIATIGLVIIAVATVINADLAITAGAIVGGAYFGDKLSPLSDTTNIAAIAVDISVYQHIQSMLYTTLPSAILAAIGFGMLDFFYPAQVVAIDGAAVDILQQTLSGISSLFNLNILLLLPPIVILFGSWKKLPPLPTLICSSVLACVLALVIQSATINDVVQTLYKGFTLDMATTRMLVDIDQLPSHFTALFNRGGLYALNDPIVITLLIFIFVGALDCIAAIPRLIGVLLHRLNKQSSLIASSLFASAITNAMTSSQYANSFIVGEAFKHKYDELGVPRKVLSRSLEDTGTMIESLVPWSTTAVFVYASLGVSVADYWYWQLLTLINIPMAFIFAFFGIGCFTKTTSMLTPKLVK